MILNDDDVLFFSLGLIQPTDLFTKITDVRDSRKRLKKKTIRLECATLRLFSL